MTEVRRYRPEDRALVSSVRNRARFWPKFTNADPDDPLNEPTIIAVDAEGRALAVGVGRKTVEAFVMVDDAAGTPQSRWQAIQDLIEFGGRDLYERGYRELHMPTSIERFARRLMTVPGVNLDTRAHLVVDLNARFRSV